jgi:ParB/RepB/Spo0J family partition protein
MPVGTDQLRNEEGGMSNPSFGFKFERLRLPLSKLLPVRHLSEPDKKVTRYRSIVSSIREVGVIEPLMVYPQGGKDDAYLIMDGHLRYYALRELGITEVECLVSIEDESFTYNARINRLSPIQEHAMITRAVKNGVSVERIAAALDMDVTEIKSRLNLLRGIHEEVAELLKDQQVSPQVFRILKRVTAVRQIEIAELLVSANNFTKAYAEGLFMVTPKDQLIDPQKPKSKAISPEDLAKMEAEMAVLERDFKSIEDAYAENMLNFTVIRGYLKRLLENAKVVRFISTKHPDLFPEFERIAAVEGM